MTIYACHRTSACCTDEDVASVAEAVAQQLGEHLAVDYDLEPPQILLWWDDKRELPDGLLRVSFCDLPEDVEPGALAWHTQEEDPVSGKVRPVLKIPVNRVLVQPGASLLEGPASLSAIFSHEALEARLDASCTIWSDTGDGRTEQAFEVVDPVQNFTYDVTLLDGRKASVSAYVKPAYWDVQAPDDPTGESFARGVPEGCLTRHHTIADSASGASDQGGGYAVRRGAIVTRVFGAGRGFNRANEQIVFGTGRLGRRVV